MMSIALRASAPCRSSKLASSNCVDVWTCVGWWGPWCQQGCGEGLGASRHVSAVPPPPLVWMGERVVVVVVVVSAGVFTGGGIQTRQRRAGPQI
eukprot:354338-Chlamydomonas_euryale.AAC.2